ncbi:hypothetical protein EI94DRAFT_1699436 [Lactarius quietus]|nr:hypothetical protein EI94DRAFT_1699436 [Lactarius quietus]
MHESVQSVDKSGQSVDKSGQSVDKSGQSVDKSGQSVDKSGQSVQSVQKSETRGKPELRHKNVKKQGQESRHMVHGKEVARACLARPKRASSWPSKCHHRGKGEELSDHLSLINGNNLPILVLDDIPHGGWDMLPVERCTEGSVLQLLKSQRMVGG